MTVYNEKEARRNWGKEGMTVKGKAKGEGEDEGEGKGEETITENIQPLSSINPNELKLGQRIIIRGDEVSFYIPPTGVQVIDDEARRGITQTEGVDYYIREAVTLERLEYCILVDENGDKRYERGPAVVFPLPTERFIEKDRKRKFKAIELTNRSGLHIKVIADYEDDHRHVAGDELFISGDEQAIHFPRVEHSIIRYGEKEQHFAVAIPRGEGRYLMDRNEGDIETVKGPKMLLPDPRNKVIVRRILTDKEVNLWYPGNTQALEYNRELRQAAAEMEEAQTLAAIDQGEDYGFREGIVSEQAYESRSLRSSSKRRRSRSKGVSESLGAAAPMAGDEFSRKTQFTQPRTLTLDTKYEGVPAINVWTGYAILVVNKDGKREVFQGPRNKLLDYDEELEVLQISTGKPKTTDDLKRTVYLRIRNNKVSDIARVETRDHVSVDIKISLLVNFEGSDPELWFQAENYVKLLCDHVRSVLKGSVQKITIEELYANHVAVVRDAVLGASVETDEGRARPGMRFEENGMVVRDVEVLGFDIKNPEIFKLLNSAQFTAVRNKIQVEEARMQLDRDLQQEAINQQTAEARTETQLHDLVLKSKVTAQTLEVNLARLNAEVTQAAEQKTANVADEEASNIGHEWKLQREREIHDQKNVIAKETQDLYIKKLKAEVDAAVQRFEAGKGGLTDALIALNRDDVMMKVAQATSVQAMIGGNSFVDVIQKIFEGTPLATLATKIAMHHPLNHHGDNDE